MDEEEDWFYASISRYKNLNMFEVEYPALHVEPTTNNSICVSSSNKQRHQLLELSLPMKLALQASDVPEVTATNNTDLKIKCGTFSHSVITQVKTMSTERKVVATHLNTCGVSVYKLSSNESDEIKKECFLKCELENPFLALTGTELVLAKDNMLPIIMMDINTGQVISKIPSNNESLVFSKELISPAYVETNLVALCHQSSGRVQAYDTREFKLANAINGTGEKNDLWSFSSLHECSEKSTTNIKSTCLAMLSRSGALKIYDSRNWNIPCIEQHLPNPNTTNCSMQVKFKPNDKCWISVSGLDANVYVYQVVSVPELVFVHDGHRHVEGFNPLDITSSHVWYPDIDNLIISSADNGTIQCWQFEDKR